MHININASFYMNFRIGIHRNQCKPEYNYYVPHCRCRAPLILPLSYTNVLHTYLYAKCHKLAYIT